MAKEDDIKKAAEEKKVRRAKAEKDSKARKDALKGKTIVPDWRKRQKA